MAVDLLYTDSNAVRACLGLSIAECRDEVMVDSKLDMELEVELMGWLPTYATINTDGTAPGATTPQILLQKLLVLYCQWFCAAKLASRHLLVPLKVTNGKDEYSRFTKLDLDALAASALAQALGYQAHIESILVDTPEATMVAYTLMSASVPDLDPITEAPA